MKIMTMRRFILEVWGYANLENRLVFFDGEPDANFISMQFNRSIIVHFEIDDSDDGSLAVPKLSEIIGGDELRTMKKDEKECRLLLEIWKECLAKYLLDVKEAGNTKMLPNIAKDHLASSL
jgi:hypothetical protein